MSNEFVGDELGIVQVAFTVGALRAFVEQFNAANVKPAGRPDHRITIEVRESSPGRATIWSTVSDAAEASR